MGRTTGVYHYRAGFGHSSVSVARRLGMVTLVNHSLAHPLFLGHLESNGGRFPALGERPSVGFTWSSIWRDIDRADVCLVNSEFVLESCVRAGMDRSRLRLVREGVDDAFLRYLPSQSEPRHSEMANLLFAGSFGLRKGAEVLLKALRKSQGMFSVRVAGEVDAQTRANLGDLFDDPRLTFLGYLPRPDLAREYARADALVLPSLAEGNARVVAEAMSAGCAVITTPNTADVEDGVHGRVVASGDPEALARALDWASSHLIELRSIGTANRVYATSVLTQRAYGRSLVRVYDEILSSERHTVTRRITPRHTMAHHARPAAQ
jgi:glycosyltransferase involved in cell wall biosynthesis